MKQLLTSLLTTLTSAQNFKLIVSAKKGPPGWRIVSWEDLYNNSDFKRRVVREMGTETTVRISEGGVLTGEAHRSKIYDSWSGKCCRKTAWI